MITKEQYKIWHFTNNITKYSEKRINEIFDLQFSLDRGIRLPFESDRKIMTYKERLFLVFSYPDKRKYQLEGKLIKRFDCGWEITDLDDALIKELEDNNWDTTNLKTTYKKVKNHPDYIKTKKKANIESLKC